MQARSPPKLPSLLPPSSLLLLLLSLLHSFRFITSVNVGPYLLFDPVPLLKTYPPQIYVYNTTEYPSLVPVAMPRKSPMRTLCYKSMWGAEFAVHDALMTSPFRTFDPSAAHFFYVPSYFKCSSLGGRRDAVHRAELALAQFLSETPWYSRSGGRDHVFLFPSGYGPNFLESWERFLSEGIFLMSEPHFNTRSAARAPYFNPFKDVTHLIKLVNSTLYPPPGRQRLACFSGSLQDIPSRLEIHRLSESLPDDVFSYSDPFPSYAQYAASLNCRFCLVPRGLSAWTLRFFEIMFSSCVPVLIDDHYQLPFENLVDFSQFIIKWPATQINASLVDYLKSIPERDVLRALVAKRRVRCLFSYYNTGDEISGMPCTAMIGLYYELWRRAPPRSFRQSPTVFWRLGGGLLTREGRPLDDRSNVTAKGSVIRPLLPIIDTFARKPAVCHLCSTKLKTQCAQKDSRLYCWAVDAQGNPVKEEEAEGEVSPDASPLDRGAGAGGTGGVGKLGPGRGGGKGAGKGRRASTSLHSHAGSYGAKIITGQNAAAVEKGVDLLPDPTELSAGGGGAGGAGGAGGSESDLLSSGGGGGAGVADMEAMDATDGTDGAVAAGKEAESEEEEGVGGAGAKGVDGAEGQEAGAAKGGRRRGRRRG